MTPGRSVQDHASVEHALTKIGCDATWIAEQLEVSAFVRGAAAGAQHMRNNPEPISLDGAALPLERGGITAISRGDFQCVSKKQQPGIDIGDRGRDSLRIGEQ